MPDRPGYVAELFDLMPLARWEQYNPNRDAGLLRGCERCRNAADRRWWHRGKPIGFSCADPICFPS